MNTDEDVLRAALAWHGEGKRVALATVVKTWEPRGTRRDAKRVAHFTAAMSTAPAERVARTVSLCLDRVEGPATVLDLGGGIGVNAREFVRRGLHVTLLDTEDVAAHALSAYGLGDVEGLDVVAADFNRDALPRGPFDIVLLSNVIHIYAPDTVRALLRGVAGVTRPGSVVAVAEQLRGHGPRASILGVRMLLKTEGGDAYTADEVQGWLRETGFDECRVDDLDAERQLVTAVRGT